ncbi:MAG TPA: hypothetical protein VHZ96_25770 [Frankiaceae bacterium]|nr:hypothetical protein [Frankiaceae bacterium]
MGVVADQLVARASLDRPFEYDAAQLRPLWLQAAKERLRERAEQIPALKARVEQADVDAVTDLAALIPFLFSHDTYKSYPRDFLDKGRWGLLAKWMSSVSTQRIPDLDYSGVETQDDWARLLGESGYPVYASSGTSGKSSFLPATPSDREFTMGCLVRSLTWQQGVQEGMHFPLLTLAPSTGDSRALEYYRRVAQTYGDPERTHFLTDEPVRLHDLNALMRLSKAVGDGTAAPEEIASFQQDQRSRSERIDGEWDRLAKVAESLEGERVILQGFWPQQFTLVERLRALGHSRLPLDPTSILSAGGGTKGTNLPADFQQQVLEFYGLPESRQASGYGMSELSAALPEIDGRYQLQPWIIPLVLTEEGTELATPDAEGRLEGRFAFLDLALEGRWGGLISGDRVVVDPTGPGFAIAAGSVMRYSDLRGGSDDRLTCAGTVGAFVTGLTDTQVNA